MNKRYEKPMARNLGEMLPLTDGQKSCPVDPECVHGSAAAGCSKGDFATFACCNGNWNSGDYCYNGNNNEGAYCFQGNNNVRGDCTVGNNAAGNS